MVCLKYVNLSSNTSKINILTLTSTITLISTIISYCSFTSPSSYRFYWSSASSMLDGIARDGGRGTPEVMVGRITFQISIRGLSSPVSFSHPHVRRLRPWWGMGEHRRPCCIRISSHVPFTKCAVWYYIHIFNNL